MKATEIKVRITGVFSQVAYFAIKRNAREFGFELLPESGPQFTFRGSTTTVDSFMNYLRVNFPSITFELI